MILMKRALAHPELWCFRDVLGLGKQLWFTSSFDWAAGMVTPGRFDDLIYVNCREISHIANLSAADLLTNASQNMDGPTLGVLLIHAEKLLFILDGFPEPQFPVDDQEGDLSLTPRRGSQ